MSGRRILVVNADDFGRSLGVNRGIVHAHEHGIVTSATLMVRWPAAEDAAAYARRRPDLSVGLHLDLSEWEYTPHGWRAKYEVVDLADARAVEAEAHRQLGRFAELVGRLPTHLDSHQHVHREEPVRQVLRRIGERLGVPVRDVTAGIRYAGDFYGQDGRGYPYPDGITVPALVNLIRNLPDGITELGCHPGDPTDLDNVYAAERAVEVATLCHEDARRELERVGVSLRSFAQL